MKILFVKLWRVFQWLFIVLKNFHLNSSESLKVFYGGGFSGNYGGAFVKIKRLQEYFPPSYLGFNIVYKLSNAIFLSPNIILHLKKLEKEKSRNGFSISSIRLCILAK